MAEFIGDEIEVLFVKKPGSPTSFIWRGAEYQITRVRDVQRRLDFRSPWFSRRHRDYYLVETDTGEAFQIYHHRGPGRRYWVLYKSLDR